MKFWIKSRPSKCDARLRRKHPPARVHLQAHRAVGSGLPIHSPAMVAQITDPQGHPSDAKPVGIIENEGQLLQGLAATLQCQRVLLQRKLAKLEQSTSTSLLLTLTATLLFALPRLVQLFQSHPSLQSFPPQSRKGQVARAVLLGGHHQLQQVIRANVRISHRDTVEDHILGEMGFWCCGHTHAVELEGCKTF